jgi:hypothetical protein
MDSFFPSVQKPTEDVLGENENVKLKLGDVTKLKKCLFLYAETSVNFHGPPPPHPFPDLTLLRSKEGGQT